MELIRIEKDVFLDLVCALVRPKALELLPDWQKVPP